MSAGNLDLLEAVQDLSLNSHENGDRNQDPKRKSISLGNYLDSAKKQNPYTYDLRPKPKKKSNLTSIEVFAAELDEEADLRFKEFMEDAKSASRFNDDESEFSDLEDNIDFDDMTCDLFSFLENKENGSVRSGQSRHSKKETKKKRLSLGDMPSSRPNKAESKNPRNSLPFGSTTSVGTPRHGKPFSPPPTPKGVLTPRNGNNDTFAKSPVSVSTPKNRLSGSVGTPKSLLTPSRSKSFSAFPTTPTATLSPCQENIRPSSTFSVSESFLDNINIDNSPTAMSTPRSKFSVPTVAAQDDESVGVKSRNSIDNARSTFASPPGHPIIYNSKDPNDPSSSAYSVWQKKGLMSNERRTTVTHLASGSPKMSSKSSVLESQLRNLKNAEIDSAVEAEEKASSLVGHSESVLSAVSLHRPGLPVVYNPNDQNDEVTKAYKVWSDMGLMNLGGRKRRRIRKKRPKKEDRDVAHMQPTEEAVEQLDWDEFLANLPAASSQDSTSSKKIHKRDPSHEFSAVLDSWNCRDGQYELIHGGILTPLKVTRNKRLYKEWKSRTVSHPTEKQTISSTTTATAETAVPATCLCSDPTLNSNDGIVEFFLPDLGMTSCTCGKEKKDLFRNKEDPTSLVNILRPWQVDFLQHFGIRRGDQLVKAHHRSANVLSKAMRSYRNMHDLAPVRTLSCGMALHIWARTCKVYVRTIRRQIRKGLELKPPSILDVLSTFLGKVAVPEERRLSNRHHHSSRMSIESQSKVEI